MTASLAAAREALMVAALLLGMVLLLGVAVLLYRRRYFANRPDENTGFTLADLKRMHRDGQLSDDEYGRLRESILGHVGGDRRHSAARNPTVTGSESEARS